MKTIGWIVFGVGVFRLCVSIAVALSEPNDHDHHFEMNSLAYMAAGALIKKAGE
jgi:hypothetical protein